MFKPDSLDQKKWLNQSFTQISAWKRFISGLLNEDFPNTSIENQKLTNNLLEPTLFLNVQDVTRTTILYQVQVLLLTMVTN